MKKILSFLFFILIAVPVYNLLFAQKSQGSPSWELKKDKNGVKVYLRSVQGEDLKEFKAVTHVHTDTETMLSLLDKVEGFKAWMSDIKEIKVLRKGNGFEKDIYIESAVPFPFRNRDVILQYQEPEVQKDGTISIRMDSKPHLSPEKNGVVRIQKARGAWHIRPVGPNEVLVEYTFFADPAGSLPDWIVNMGLIDGPFQSMTNLQAMFP